MEIFTVAQAAERLKVGKTKAYEMILKGQLPAHRLNPKKPGNKPQYRIIWDEVIEQLKKQ